jgi:hypothetical protein
MLMVCLDALARFDQTMVVMITSLGGTDSTLFWRCNDAERDPRIARES